MSEHNGNGPAEKDILLEAHAIISGHSARLPSKEHLVAVQNTANKAVLIASLLNKALIGAMLEARRTRMTVPAAIVEQIEQKQIDLDVTRPPNGAITAILVRNQ